MPLIQRSTPYAHWEFSDPASGDQLRLVPERGGLVTGWRCSGREMLYFDQERFLDRSKSVRGGIPVLFPICGGLPDDRLPLPRGEFTLPQHGFARDRPWQLAQLDDGRGVALRLEDSAETLAVYPFSFALTLEVRLAASALEIEVIVDNRGDQPMPYSVGLHPYFNVSGLEVVRFEGLPAECLDHSTMKPASTMELVAQLGRGVDLLVRPTETEPPIPAVGLVDPEAGTRLELQLTPPLDLVVIWTDPPRSMVCLEPWSGPRQALISGDRRLELAPGESRRLGCRYGVGPVTAGSTWR